MRLQFTCLLYTQDQSVARRFTAYMESMARVHIVDDPFRLETSIEQNQPCMLILDIRTERSREMILRIRENHPDTVMIVLGEGNSDPIREAAMLGAFATEELEPERRRFQMLAKVALDRLRLLQEIQILKTPPPYAPVQGESGRTGHSAASGPLQHLIKAFRHFDNLDALYDHIVEGMSGSARVSRVGIVAQDRQGGPYRLLAGLRCLEEFTAREYAQDDPLVRWLKMRAHIVSRSNLEHIVEPSNRLLLKNALDSMGAEIIIPLHARNRLMGWLFLGHRSTGIPFDNKELEELMIVADHISITVENAALYEETALQKTLAETLFHSMPTGIVAVGADGYIRWFNEAAEKILDKPSGDILNQPVGRLGSIMADYLYRTYLGESIPSSREWVDPSSRRHLSVQTRRLMDKDQHCLGAVALIHDQTETLKLREKQEQLERSAFWTELAASMSHEIRNPLVSIKTFAQLLPERYDDPEFRAEFSELVTVEVERLNKIIDQINSFANPPSLEFKPLDMAAVVREARDLALSRCPDNNADINIQTDKDLPEILGDRKTLTESMAHLVANALEASGNRGNTRINVHVKRWAEDSNESAPAPGVNGSRASGIMLSIKDNAGGIKEDIREKIYSPFCTTKAKGMGLGLSIVKRTVVEHNGQIQIDTDSTGTEITIILPKQHKDEQQDDNSSNEPGIDFDFLSSTRLKEKFSKGGRKTPYSG